MTGIYHHLQKIEKSNHLAALCTIVDTKGSAPRKKGSKMIVFAGGKIIGSIGGGALEKKVIAQAQEVLKNNTAQLFTHHLVTDLAMCCGGTVQLFIEPIMNKKKLYIFGAGHIGKALSKFAAELDFDVSVIDDRYEMFEDMDESIGDMYKEHYATAIEKLSFDEFTYVVILTHDHQYDREIVALTALKPHAYIGMVGSQRKVEIAKKNLLSAHLLSKEIISKVDMPIGMDINAITPQEIAISILAKLIAVRNSR